MLDKGRDTLGDPPVPLFSPLVDVHWLRMVPHRVPVPPGIRPGDMSWRGNNLMHDIPFLEALRVLSEATGDGRYREAVKSELDFFAHNCPHPETGLFPWGEHAQWCFVTKEAQPNAALAAREQAVVHDHLRFAPEWLWKELWDRTPEAVLGFARGLDGHIVNQNTFEHCRHAGINSRWDRSQPRTGAGTDFARHSGFYIFDCLFAYRESQDVTLLDWARKKLAWHVDRRLPTGIIPSAVRTPQEHDEGQHDLLALCTFDAGTMLGEDTPEGKEFHEIACQLLEARAALDGQTSPVPQTNDLCAWGWAYGQSNASEFIPGLRHKQIYDRTGVAWYGDAVVERARMLMKAPPPPDHFPSLAWDFWGNMELAVEAYLVSGDRAFLDHAAKVAGWAIEKLVRRDVIMGASNMQYMIGGYYGNTERPGYYYSCSGTPSLVRGFLRLALIQEGKTDILGTDAHFR